MKSAQYDFLFPTYVLIIDPGPWPPLSVKYQGTAVRILKPIVDQATRVVTGSIGNQGLDVYSTILRVELSSDNPPVGQILYPVAQQCLAWIRALTRQYWLGFTGSGTASVRGSSLITDVATGVGKPGNFGMFGTTVISQNLDDLIWRQVEQPLLLGQVPRTADMIFCNGMLAMRDGNYHEAIALLGIACEVEIGECLQFIVSARNDSAIDLLFKRARMDFTWKLNNLLPELSGKSFAKDEPHWHRELVQLYQARGSAAHSTPSADILRDAPKFVLAADSFLRWVHGIRSARGESLGPCPQPLRATIGTTV